MRTKVSLVMAGALALIAAAGAKAHAQLVGAAQLKPNTPFLNCLERTVGVPPAASVLYSQDTLNDDLRLTATGLKPGLAFDVFTVQNSNLLSNGSINPNFKNFGLAWYQSDLVANSAGVATATIRSIFVNQIFGFDPAVSLPPTNTFHVGFWFNNPGDASACGFVGSTPFNGEHNAGPLAMITLPNATTNLGPLCLSPVFSGGVWKCNP